MQKSTFTSVKNLRYFVPKPNQMTMNKKLLTVALSLTVIPSVLLAQKSATEHTIRANEAVKTELNFNDRQDYEDANRGPLPRRTVRRSFMISSICYTSITVSNGAYHFMLTSFH